MFVRGLNFAIFYDLSILIRNCNFISFYRIEVS
jgi:hypothetical protein